MCFGGRWITGDVNETLHGGAVIFAALRAIGDGVAHVPGVAVILAEVPARCGHRNSGGGGDGFQPAFAAGTGRRHGGGTSKGAMPPDAPLPYEVDGITGATLTTNGVAAMVKEGLQKYIGFINTKTAAQQVACEAACSEAQACEEKTEE